MTDIWDLDSLWCRVIHILNPHAKENPLKSPLQYAASIGWQVGKTSISYGVKLTISWVDVVASRRLWSPLQCPFCYHGGHWDQVSGKFLMSTLSSALGAKRLPSSSGGLLKGRAFRVLLQKMNTAVDLKASRTLVNARLWTALTLLLWGAWDYLVLRKVCVLHTRPNSQDRALPWSGWWCL